MAHNLVDRMTLRPVNAIAHPQVCSVEFHTVIYLVALVFGAIVMSFQMLGPRYLNPYFGNGIYIGGRRARGLFLWRERFRLPRPSGYGRA
jgi:hypothetical protein